MYNCHPHSRFDYGDDDSMSGHLIKRQACPCTIDASLSIHMTQIKMGQMDLRASTQTVIREPSFLFQCSCSQNDELLAFSSRSAPNLFGTTQTPYDTNQNGTNGLWSIHESGHLIRRPACPRVRALRQRLVHESGHYGNGSPMNPDT